MHAIRFRRLAEQDVEEAVEWYNGESYGLGSEFLEQLKRDVTTIAEAPNRWPFFQPDVRRYVMTRFPYLIYYFAESGIVHIQRVVHGSRDPETVKRTLE